MKILHLEDNKHDAALVQDLLELAWPDCAITVVVSREDYLGAIRSGAFDIVVSDYQIPGFDGMEALTLVRDHAPDLPFVFFSGTIGEERAIEAVKAGAADYVIKDRMQRLPIAIERAVRDAEVQRARRSAEQELARERYLMRMLMEHLPDSVYFKDAESRFIAVSNSLACRHGYEPSALKGKSDRDLFQAVHAEATFRDEQEIVRTGIPIVNKEEKEAWPDGSVRWVASTKLPLRDASGRIVGTFGVSHDITSRKEAAERIREQAEIIDQSPVAVIIADLGHRVAYCNKGAIELYGLSREDLVGHTADEIFTAETMEKLGPGREAAIATGSWTGDVPIVTKAGRRAHAQFHMSLINDAAGRPRARLSIAIDITERKRLEDQFLRSQRLEAIGTLAGGVAHDLNNTLAPIMMGVEMLREQLPGEEQVFTMILDSAKRGADMVRLLLTYAKGSEGERAAIPPERLIKEIVHLMKGSFPKSIKIGSRCDRDIPSVLGDATQLHQVLLNLCVNARDAMPDGGTLTLEAECRDMGPTSVGAPPDLEPGRYVLLRVRDTGTGIAPEIMDRIMDPFFSTKGPEKGTGLGLSTVVGIVKGHGGYLHVQSKIGFGSTFTVFLPVATAAAEAPVAGKVDSELRGDGETILFIDDEPAVRDVARAVMRRLNYKPLTATDGSDGLIQALLNRSELRAVITDVHMPHMDGIAFVRAFRKMQPGTPVMLASGRLEEEERAEFAANGVVHRLDKPFSAPQLAHALKALLASGKK
jgi:two-component system, cell cycle sensor histidine kinase and response regulator CckA